MQLPVMTIPYLLFALASVAHADETSCNSYAFVEDHIKLALVSVKVDPEQKLYFYKDEKSCPEKGDACKSKAYVLAGDELISNQRRGDWVCAWYPGAKRETVGWVRVDRLQNKISLAEASKAKPEEWLGNWAYYKYAELNIKKKGKLLGYEGNAVWDDGGGNNHVGSISGTMTPQANKAFLKEGTAENACKLELSLLGSYLVVKDNNVCGGLNVSFSGVYRKAKLK
ncbi:hypothetical protein ACO0LG_06620 [Undibacterium sp. Ji42W]|uniref:hypothetical protein n=1 Tax=Undibacterium sp. Ji42W TaxID=3413039 RepID=UPI003BF408A3